MIGRVSRPVVVFPYVPYVRPVKETLVVSVLTNARARSRRDMVAIQSTRAAQARRRQ